MKYHQLSKADIVNGPGLRVVLWVSGCPFCCAGCHNPQTRDLNSGREFTDDVLFEIYAELEHDWCTGLTISGGDPMHPSNRKKVLEICKLVKDNYPNKTIWVYTGYTIEQLPRVKWKNIDVLVDGQFIKELRYEPLPEWRGSHNQRIINLKN